MLLSITVSPPISLFIFFNATATTEIYTLSLHDALPISSRSSTWRGPIFAASCRSSPSARIECRSSTRARTAFDPRSEEHTSELQSQSNLVCRLLLEKKKHTHLHLNDSHLHTAPHISLAT